MKIEGFCASSLLMASLWNFIKCIELAEKHSKVVEAEQYKYFKVYSEGPFKIELESLTGDADLYVSDESTQPTYENYVLKSATCGIDTIHVPSSFRRPIHVGVYGYFVFERSEFTIQVLPEEEPFDWFSDYNQEVEVDENFNRKPGPSRPPPPPKMDEEESILWTIFIGILKIIFDILV